MYWGLSVSVLRAVSICPEDKVFLSWRPYLVCAEGCVYLSWRLCLSILRTISVCLECRAYSVLRHEGCVYLSWGLCLAVLKNKFIIFSSMAICICPEGCIYLSWGLCLCLYLGIYIYICPEGCVYTYVLRAMPICPEGLVYLSQGLHLPIMRVCVYLSLGLLSICPECFVYLSFFTMWYLYLPILPNSDNNCIARKIKNLALCGFPSHKIGMLNLQALLETLIYLNGPLGGVNPHLGQLCVHVDRLFYYHITITGWEPPPSLIWRAWVPI
jgi:hypothetical protein